MSPAQCDSASNQFAATDEFYANVTQFASVIIAALAKGCRCLCTRVDLFAASTARSCKQFVLPRVRSDARGVLWSALCLEARVVTVCGATKRSVVCMKGVI